MLKKWLKKLLLVGLFYRGNIYSTFIQITFNQSIKRIKLMKALSPSIQIDELVDSLKKLSKEDKETFWSFLEADLKKDEVSDS